MKQALIVLVFTLVSSLAYADVAEEHAKNCQTSEALELAGKEGSCRVVVVPKPIQTKGFCEGTFMKSIKCSVTYIVVKEGAFANLTCGDSEKPILNENMRAESIGYNVVTLITTSTGKDIVINDNNEYTLISSNRLSFKIAESDVDGTTDKEATIGINLGQRIVQLENVSCN